MPLTPEQIAEYRNKYKLGTTITPTQESSVDGFANASGYLSRVKSDVSSKLTEAVQSQKSSMAGTMNPFSAGANIAKNVTGAVLSPVTQAIAPVAEKTIGPALSDVTENIMATPPVQKFIDVASTKPELSGAIADTLETGLNVAGIEGTVSQLVSAKNLAVNTFEKVKSAIPPGGAGPMFETLKGKIVPTSPEIMNRVARLKPTDATKFEKVAGKTHGEYLTETGNFGTPDKIIANESTKFAKSIQAVDDELAKLPGIYKDGSVSDALKMLLEKSRKVSGENIKSPYHNQVKEWVTKYNAGGLTMSDINQVKRLFEREVKLGYNKLTNADAVQKATYVDNALRTWQVKQANQLGFKNIAELNKQTQISKFLINKLGDQVVGQSGLNGVSLTDWIMLSGGDATSITGFLTKKFFSNKAVQAKIAEMLNKGNIKGQVVPDIGPSQVKQLPEPVPGSPQSSINVPIEMPTRGVLERGTEVVPRISKKK